MLSRRPAGEPFIAVPAFAVPDGGGTARRPRDRRRPGGRQRGLQSRVLRRPPTRRRPRVESPGGGVSRRGRPARGATPREGGGRPGTVPGRERLDDRVRDSLPGVPGPEGPRLRRRSPRRTRRFPGVSGDRAVVIDEVQAKALHDAGFFGKIVGRRLQLSLLETAYLLKAGLVEVRNADTDRPIRLPRLIKEAKALQPDFELRLQAYEDLTSRGVISKTGFKYGSHFRAYEGDPETHHAKYLVHVVPKGHRGAWPEISRAVRLAHGVKKQILFGEVGDGVRYVKLERVRP